MLDDGNTQQIRALWPSLPIYDKSYAALTGTGDTWALTGFPVLGQNLSCRVSCALDTALPPSCSVSLTWKRGQGRLHVDGGWLNALCVKAGLSAPEQDGWSRTGLPLTEFLLRWLLSGLFNQLSMAFEGDPIVEAPSACSSMDRGARLALTLRAADASEKTCIWLDLPQSLLAVLPRKKEDACDALWQRVPVVASLRAGHQTLPLHQLESLAYGDVVLLCKPLDALQLVLPSGQQSDVRIDGNHYVVTNGWYMDERREVSVSTVNEQVNGIGEDMFEHMNVQLVCEVGRISLTIAELKSLKPGAVLPMERRAQQAVDLVANGLKIGQGELVRLDDTLGVRVTRMAKSNG